jgi:hypothetical protein
MNGKVVMSARQGRGSQAIARTHHVLVAGPSFATLNLQALGKYAISEFRPVFSPRQLLVVGLIVASPLHSRGESDAVQLAASRRQTARPVARGQFDGT